ncbi:MAG TPA: protein kinase, partial [Vicinamibacterales bacterium]
MQPAAFGHYRVDARIGAGGMGEVYRAFDTRLNRPIAIKVMRRVGDGDLSIERFLREARAASALNHPNIVVIHEVGETDAGEHYIVQELIEGETLRDLLASGGTPMQLAMVVEVGSQTARALAAAHAAGLMHRDIKPENIMLRPDGFVKVLDFGLARSTAGTGSSTSATTHLATAPGVMLGTPSYMSPEQANGGEIGPPLDVFALGIVLYEMTTGRRPFTGATPFAVIANIISEQPVRPSQLNPAVPRALDDLLMQMLEKDPARRPTAKDVEKQLSASTGTILLGDLVTSSGAPRATVGRDDQRAQLLRGYARVKAGRGTIVGVSGEPGIGKTSLVEDFLSDLAAKNEHPTIARGRCSESLAGSEAFLPVLEVLDSLLHRSDGPSLSSVIKLVAPTWYVQVATDSTDTTSLGELRDRAPAGSQERMKRELGALLQEISRNRPLVLFIDDLHWADVSTIDMLNYLAARLSDMRLMIVTSYRPSDMAIAKHPFLAVRNELQARGVFEELELRFLDTRDVERYLSLQFPGHAFPPDFAEAIHTKTEGSPLFMADLVRYLHDTGGIVEDGGTWRLARGVPEVPKDLPESVKGMIARNIERLDEGSRRLLLAASVQGHEFDSAVVAEAAEMDPADVEERLETLERVHVFVTRGEEYEFPDRSLTLKYRFVHVLYQNVLYGSLQPTRRAALSRRIVKALLAHYGDEAASIAGRLALLFETAREFASSANYFLAAARKSNSLFAFREALSLADRGLAGLKGLPESPEL